MGQKDIAEKRLEEHNDTFADIFNGFIFNGEQIIHENDLEPVETNRNSYNDGEKLYELERDVAKYWKGAELRLALLGIENQTAIDDLMPARLMAYDGLAYNTQIKKYDAAIRKYNCMMQEYKKNAENGIQKPVKPVKNIVPVYTLVLYFGEGEWKTPLSLYESLNIPKELNTLIPDYHIKVINMRYLDQKVIDSLKSDFKLLAEYFTHINDEQLYIPKADNITHYHDVLNVFKAITGNDEVAKAYVTMMNKMNGDDTMSYNPMAEKLTAYWNQAKSEGRAEGVTLGITKGKIEMILSMLADKMSIANITKYSNLPEERIREIAADNHIIIQ